MNMLSLKKTKTQQGQTKAGHQGLQQERVDAKDGSTEEGRLHQEEEEAAQRDLQVVRLVDKAGRSLV